jgi:hypothetical protein
MAISFFPTRNNHYCLRWHLSRPTRGAHEEYQPATMVPGSRLTQQLKRFPVSEVLFCAGVILIQVVLAPGVRTASDWLFIEGMTLSVVGSYLTIRRGMKKARSSRTSRAPALRILTVGIVLITASILIGQLLVAR